jgi:hypothetical protein
MAFELRNTTFHACEPEGKAGMVSFFAGDAADAQQSTLWISGQVESDMQSMKSLALNQLATLYRARDLIDNEIGRLKRLYDRAEQSQR